MTCFRKDDIIEFVDDIIIAELRKKDMYDALRDAIEDRKAKIDLNVIVFVAFFEKDEINNVLHLFMYWEGAKDDIDNGYAWMTINDYKNRKDDVSMMIRMVGEEIKSEGEMSIMNYDEKLKKFIAKDKDEAIS